MYLCVCVCSRSNHDCLCLYMLQDEPEWVPGEGPVNSIVPPPPHAASQESPFNRSEFEVFATHTMSSKRTGDAQGDWMLEWATNPKYKGDRIRYVKMKTMGNKAVKLNIPAGVQEKDFSEPADGAQQMVFFYRSLYDAIKQLLRNARFKGRQYTEFEKVYSVGHKRQYGAINRGEMYEIAQGRAGRDVSPLPVFISSDATVICKSMGAHPIISECNAQNLQCFWLLIFKNIHIYAYTGLIQTDIYRYIHIHTCTNCVPT